MPLYPKYTFFEMTTQNGFVTSLFRDKVPKHHSYTLDRDGQHIVYRAFKHASPEPYFTFRVPGRNTLQTQLTWEIDVREEAEKQWKQYRKQLEAARTTAVDTPASGEAGSTPEPSYQQLLEVARASSTAPATEPGLSPSTSPVEVLGSTDSGPSGPTTPSSEISEPSTPSLKKASGAKASKSPSSSGKSGAGTSSGTARAVSTSPAS